MAKYKLEKVSEVKGEKTAHYQIEVKFGKKTFRQDVLLPSDSPEKAAQEYADDYEKQYKGDSTDESE